MNGEKHSVPYKSLFSIFLYLKSNSALDNVLFNNQYRQKNQTDTKNKEAGSNHK